MRITMVIVTALALVGCGANTPPPNAEFAQAKLDLGRAQESGGGVADAQLHMRLAQENLDSAKTLMATNNSKDNERAAQIIARASAESELALSLAREAHARTELQQAQAQLGKPITVPAGTPMGTPTTTGADMSKKNP